MSAVAPCILSELNFNYGPKRSSDGPDGALDRAQRLLWGRFNEATKRASDGPVGALDRARAFIVGMKFSLKKLWKYHRIQFFAFFSVQERRRAF